MTRDVDIEDLRYVGELSRESTDIVMQYVRNIIGTAPDSDA